MLVGYQVKPCAKCGTVIQAGIKRINSKRANVKVRLGEDEEQYSVDQRNRSVPHSMMVLLNHDFEKFKTFKAIGAKFRNGKLDGSQFRSLFVNTFGRRRASEILYQDIVGLVSDAQQQDLLHAQIQDLNQYAEAVEAAKQLRPKRTEQSGPRIHRASRYCGGDLKSLAHSRYRYITGVYGLEQDAELASEGQRLSAGADIEVEVNMTRSLGDLSSTSSIYMSNSTWDTLLRNRDSTRKNVLVWLRRDFRLTDNPALNDAVRLAQQLGGHVYFVYIHSPEQSGSPSPTGPRHRPGLAANIWTHHSLRSFSRQLRTTYGSGASLLVRQGMYDTELADVCDCLRVTTVIANALYEPWSRDVDTSTSVSMAALGVEVRYHAGALLEEPEKVVLDADVYMGAFGSVEALSTRYRPTSTLATTFSAPETIPTPPSPPHDAVASLDIDALHLTTCASSETADTTGVGGGITTQYDISEQGGRAVLNKFVSTNSIVDSVASQRYQRWRFYLSGKWSSGLGAYIRGGQLSVNSVLEAVADGVSKKFAKSVYRRLVWRDLAYWALHNWQHMTEEPIRENYQHCTYSDDQSLVTAWQRGMTGYPLVDAAMRQLRDSGWMPQHLRMICARYLTTMARAHWRAGAAWFIECLVDGDVAINSMMWQNAMGCGLDQWKFQPRPDRGVQCAPEDYIKRWVPELADLTGLDLLQPWTCSTQALAEAGVVLGDNYPHRQIPDIVGAQNDWYQGIVQARQQQPQLVDNKGFDLVVAPEGSTLNADGRLMQLTTADEVRRSDRGETYQQAVDYFEKNAPRHVRSSILVRTTRDPLANTNRQTVQQ